MTIIFHGNRRQATAFAQAHALESADVLPLYENAKAVEQLAVGGHTVVVRPERSLVEPGPDEGPRMTPEVDEALYQALLANRAIREWDGTDEDFTAP
jgi:hypothetical protein